MSDHRAPDPRALAGGRFLVDVTQRLPDAGGGITAFAATDTRGPGASVIALLVDRHAPARPRPLQMLNTGIEGLLMPLAHGPGPPADSEAAWYVICQPPDAPPVSAGLRPWPEAQLIEHVLRPAALVLEQLHARGLTHRAIRANNVFHDHSTHPVTLGAAWAAPPAMHQPAVYETPYAALCHPAARGDGRIADDVYALGVLLVTLALGRTPMEGLDDKAILYRKLELGDFAAITAGERLPPMLTDIVRGMLAEDPDHRPSPALLRDPAGARGRRIAARPPARAQRPLRVGAMTVWNNRTLALAMASEPAEALAEIQNGTMMFWLRRALGDTSLAVKLEELVRQHALDVSTAKETAQALLLMRAITDADILMPLCWHGLAIFPDGIGPALTTAREAEPELHRKLQEIITCEAQGTWATLRETRATAAPQRLEARHFRAILQIRGPAGGLPRLGYTLNPLTPCASPLFRDRWITNIAELAPALDAVAVTSPDSDLMEPHVAAFIGARSERWLDQEVQALANIGDDTSRVLHTLRLLAELQHRYHPAPLTGLSSWLVARAHPLVERWKNRERRTVVEEQLKSLAASGFLRPILGLLEDHDAHAADSDGLSMARANLARVDSELRGIADGGPHRSAFATRLGQEIAAGIGLAAIAGTLALAAMG